MAPFCWLKQFSPEVECDGRLDRVHLIPQQLLRREGFYDEIWDPVMWVAGCRKHHGMLDVSRTLRVPRSAIPYRTSQWAAMNGLLWYLDREYGAPTVLGRRGVVPGGAPTDGEEGTDAQRQ